MALAAEAGRPDGRRRPSQPAVGLLFSFPKKHAAPRTHRANRTFRTEQARADHQVGRNAKMAKNIRTLFLALDGEKKLLEVNLQEPAEPSHRGSHLLQP